MSSQKCAIEEKDYAKLVERLRRREELGLSCEEVEDLCFEILENHFNEEEQCNAAVILSDIIEKDGHLEEKLDQFLEDNNDLDDKAEGVLLCSLLKVRYKI